jgi:hypothetical protein
MTWNIYCVLNSSQKWYHLTHARTIQGRKCFVKFNWEWNPILFNIKTHTKLSLYHVAFAVDSTVVTPHTWIQLHRSVIRLRENCDTSYLLDVCFLGLMNRIDNWFQSLVMNQIIRSAIFISLYFKTRFHDPTIDRLNHNIWVWSLWVYI